MYIEDEKKQDKSKVFCAIDVDDTNTSNDYKKNSVTLRL